MRLTPSRLARSLAACLAIPLALAGCLDDRTVAPDPTALQHAPVQLALAARVSDATVAAAAVTGLDVRVYYLRTDGTTADLLRRRVAIASGTQPVSLTLDPAACLADGRRAPTLGANACVIGATLTLLGDNAATLDSSVVLPLEVAAGDTRAVGEEITLGTTDWKQLSVGAFATCGLRRDGTAYCWGNNEVGQLANAAANTRTPSRIDAPVRFARISAGLGGACALTAAGQAYCWGLDEYGGLGRGSRASERCTSSAVSDRAATRVTVSGPLACGRSVQAVAGGHTFRAISVGGAHACALTPAGRAYCWGPDKLLGAAGTSDAAVATPTPVIGGLAFASISAGAFHTCALAESGAAFCWGSDDLGALGAGNTSAPGVGAAPSAVTGGLAFRTISAGADVTCGVTTGDEAFCWGSDAYLQLGVESRTRDDATPYRTPRRVALSQPVSTIAAGWRSTCAVTRAGAAFCWGSAESGALGVGTPPSPLAQCTRGTEAFACAPLPLAVTGGLAFASIGVGFQHACATTRAGVAYCWGDDQYGQLGAGRSASSGSSPVPVAVQTPP